MDYVTIRDKNDEAISKSRNLRGLRRAVGYRMVYKVSIDRWSNGEGKLCVIFINRDSCEVNFASYSVLCDTVRKWNNLYGVPLFVKGDIKGNIEWFNPALMSGRYDE